MAKRGNKAGARSPKPRQPKRAAQRPADPRPATSRPATSRPAANSPAPRTASAREAAAAMNGPWSSHLLAVTGMFGLMGSGFLVFDPAGDTSRMWVLAAAAGVATLLLYQTWRDHPRFSSRATKILTVTALVAYGLLVARALGSFS